MLIILLSSAVVITVSLAAWLSQVRGYAVVIGREVAVRAPANGRVMWMAPSGERVRRGDKVAELDATARSLQLKEAQAELAAAREERELTRREQERELHLLRAKQEETRIGLAQASEDLAIGETNLGYDAYVDQMTASLHDLSLVSDRERREIEHTREKTQLGVTHGKNVLSSRKKQLAQATLAIDNHFGLMAQSDRVAEARIAALESRCARIQQQVEAATLLATMDGIVVRAYVDSGSDVNEGDVVVTVLDGNDLAVAVFVPEEELTNVALVERERVRIRFHAFPLRSVEGEVVQEMPRVAEDLGPAPPGLERHATPREGMVLASRVRFDDNLPFHLRPGMTGTVLLDRRGLLWPLRALALFGLDILGT